MAGGEADRVAQPLPWRFQDSGQTKHFSRLHDRDGGSRHATSHAVADTAHRADQINVQVSRACRQTSVQSASLLSPRQPEPFLTCGLDIAEPHIRSPLIAAGTEIPHTRGSSGSERAEPIFITASCSQDVMRSARRDPARVSFPRGWRGSPLTLRRPVSMNREQLADFHLRFPGG
jgi:hypothetical protein